MRQARKDPRHRTQTASPRPSHTQTGPSPSVHASPNTSRAYAMRGDSSMRDRHRGPVPRSPTASIGVSLDSASNGGGDHADSPFPGSFVRSTSATVLHAIADAASSSHNSLGATPPCMEGPTAMADSSGQSPPRAPGLHPLPAMAVLAPAPAPVPVLLAAPAFPRCVSDPGTGGLPAQPHLFFSRESSRLDATPESAPRVEQD